MQVFSMASTFRYPGPTEKEKNSYDKVLPLLLLSCWLGFGFRSLLSPRAGFQPLAPMPLKLVMRVAHVMFFLSQVLLADLIKISLSVFINDNDSESWTQFPFCNFITWVIHNEGVAKTARISANKTPRAHYRFLTGEAPKIDAGDDGRPDFNMSTPDGIFTMVGYWQTYIGVLKIRHHHCSLSVSY